MLCFTADTQGFYVCLTDDIETGRIAVFKLVASDGSVNPSDLWLAYGAPTKYEVADLGSVRATLCLLGPCLTVEDIYNLLALSSVMLVGALPHVKLWATSSLYRLVSKHYFAFPLGEWAKENMPPPEWIAAYIEAEKAKG